MLGSNNHRRIGAGQAQPLRHHRGNQRAELFVIADNAVDATAIFFYQLIDIAPHIEGDQACVFRERKKIEAFVEKRVTLAITRLIEFVAVPILGEQYQYLLHNSFIMGSHSG